ncbi:MAG: UDP-glucuronate decarboxylase [Bacteroidia bacterium]|jgi:UDP-glucuronate decarboxylase
MSKILVTGGAGFVGSSLVDRLSENAENHIVVVDNLLTGDAKKVPVKDNVKFIKCDVNKFEDISAVFYSNHFDFVFHYAAVVGVQRTLDNPIMVLDDVKGFENLLMLCKNTGVKRVFFSSSSEVYGEPFEFPQNEETTPLNSRLPYAIVKNIGEAYIKSFYQEFGLEYTIFRYFNTYGPKQSDDFVISKFLKKALQNEPITIYGDGSQTRTFCYVDDNVDTCLKCMEEDTILNDTVNIGGADEMTVLELAKVIIKVTDSSSEIVHLPALKEGDMTRRQPDNTKMKEILKRDLTPLEEGLKRVLKSWGKLK